MEFLIFILILTVSFIFAMLGLGGGMVYVPLLHWMGFDFKQIALPLGLLLNGLNTMLALIPYSRKKLVDWKGGSFMAVSAMIGSPLGAYTSQFVNTHILKLIFAFVVVFAAIRMLFIAGKEAEKMASLRKKFIGIIVGLSVGFLGGMLGIGGGFIFAPVLMWLGYKTKNAAATTAYVVTFSSFTGFLGHVSEGHFNPWLTAVVIIAVIIGSQLGANFMTSKAKPKTVKQIYALVLFGIGLKFILEIL